MKSSFFGTLRKQTSVIFNSRFFNELSHLEAYEFIQLCHRRTYSPEEYIYHQKDPGNGFYIVESGTVELIVEDEAGQPTGNSIVLGPTQTFGNLSLKHQMRRMSSARATEESVVLGFFNPDFEELRKRYPQIALKVISEINRVMAIQLESTISELSKLSSEADAYRLQCETFYTRDDELL